MTQLSIDDLSNTFIQHQHKENQEPMANYMRNQFSFYGIKATERRKLSRPFLNALKKHTRETAKETDESPLDWTTVYNLWALDQREYQYVGMDYARGVDSYLVSSDITHLRQIITTKSWWDTVDNLSKALGTLIKNFPEHKETMITWSRDDNLWIRRAAILHQLSFAEDTDTELLSTIIKNNLGSDEFFINKAIGWILRDYAKHDRTFVETFISRHEKNLSTLSVKEASKHF